MEHILSEYYESVKQMCRELQQEFRSGEGLILVKFTLVTGNNVEHQLPLSVFCCYIPCSLYSLCLQIYVSLCNHQSPVSRPLQPALEQQAYHKLDS